MTALAKLEVIADKLRNLSRIMAGGDGTARIDTPAWKRAAELADELETIRAALSPAELGGVEWPVVFAERLADGWRFEYEPETKFVGLRHPHGGRQSVVRVEYGAYADEIGAAIAASMNASTPRAAEAVSEAELAEVIQRHTGCADSDSIYAAVAVLQALTPPSAKGE